MKQRKTRRTKKFIKSTRTKRNKYSSKIRNKRKNKVSSLSLVKRKSRKLNKRLHKLKGGDVPQDKNVPMSDMTKDMGIITQSQLESLSNKNQNNKSEESDEEFLNVRRERSIKATPEEQALCNFSYNIFGPNKLNKQMEYKELCDYDDKYLQKQNQTKAFVPLFKREISSSSDAMKMMQGIFESVIYDIEKGGGVFEIKNLDAMKKDIDFYQQSGLLTEDDKNSLLETMKDTEENYVKFIANVLKNNKFLPVAGGSEVEIKTPYDWFQAIRNIIRILSNTQKAININIQSKIQEQNKQNKTKSTKRGLFSRSSKK